MINFYKALNYLQLNNMEDALVEVRKINIRLQQLNDKYPDHKNRYQRDAFAQLLMGLIYDAAGDYIMLSSPTGMLITPIKPTI